MAFLKLLCVFLCLKNISEKEACIFLITCKLVVLYNIVQTLLAYGQMASEGKTVTI
jgi:hypothetical protein